MKKRFLKPVGLMMLAVTALTAVLSGCKEKEPEYPTQAKLEILGEDGKKVDNGHQFTINKAGGDANALSIAITGTRDWTLTQQDGTDWLTVSPKSGEKDKNTTLTLSATANTEAQRESKITVKANDGSATANFTVVQAGNDTPGADAIYFEDLGDYKTGTDIKKDNNGNWPSVEQFSSWRRGGDIDQSAVTYTESATVRNSGELYDKEVIKVSKAPYVVMNTGKNGEFMINGIALGGKTNLTLKFAAQHTEKTEETSPYTPTFTPVTPTTVKVQAGFDGESYAELSYTVEVDGNSWYWSTAEFKVPAGTEKLYIKYNTFSGPGSLRLDDFTLTEGGNGALLEPAAPPVGQGEVRIKDFIANTWKTGDKVPKNTLFVGTIISDKVGNNLGYSANSFFIMDGTDENSGIYIYGIRNDDDSDFGTYDFKVGDNVKIDISEASMTEFSGLRQLTKVKASNITAAADAATYNTPVELTAAADMSKYQSMLVKLAAEPTSSSAGEKWYSGTANNVTRSFVDAGEKEFNVCIYKTAAFAAEEIPSAKGTITGIVGYYNAPQLMPRNASDIDLNTAVELPQLSVTPGSLSFEAAGGTETIAVTATVPEGYELKLEKGADDSWYTAEFNGEKTQITVTTQNNAGGRLSGSLKVFIADAKGEEVTDITQDIGISQSAAGSGEEKTATFDFAAIGAANGWDSNTSLSDSKGVFTEGDITLTFEKGTHSSTVPAWNGGLIRMYAFKNNGGGNTLTVSGGTILQIDFTYGAAAADTAADFAASAGNLSSPYETWTGSSESVVFSVSTTGKDSVQRRIAKVVVTYQ